MTVLAYMFTTMCEIIKPCRITLTKNAVSATREFSLPVLNHAKQAVTCGGVKYTFFFGKYNLADSFPADKQNAMCYRFSQAKRRSSPFSSNTLERVFSITNERRSYTMTTILLTKRAFLLETRESITVKK